MDIIWKWLLYSAVLYLVIKLYYVLTGKNGGQQHSGQEETEISLSDSDVPQNIKKCRAIAPKHLEGEVVKVSYFDLSGDYDSADVEIYSVSSAGIVLGANLDTGKKVKFKLEDVISLGNEWEDLKLLNDHDLICSIGDEVDWEELEFSVGDSVAFVYESLSGREALHHIELLSVSSKGFTGCAIGEDKELKFSFLGLEGNIYIFEEERYIRIQRCHSAA